MAVNTAAPHPGRGPVAVFPAVGADMWGPVQELRGLRSIRVSATPRHATVLLVAGTVPDEHRGALSRVHDQTPHPRTVVGWRVDGAADMPCDRAVGGDLDAICGAIHDIAGTRAAWSRTGAAGRAGDRPASGAAGELLPDEDPTEWRGVGPFGQGGEGMMGGTPYGRPMAMTGDDRDGLALDQLHLSLGPFLDALPAGLILDVTLQGDLMQQVTPRLPAGDAIRRAASSPTDTGVHGLRWLAHALHVAGLDALAARAAALATRTTRATTAADRAGIARRTAWLLRAVARSGVIRGLRGVGHDARSGDDSATRWQRHLGEIEQGSSRDRLARPATTAGPDETRALLERVLPGVTWADAVATIVSLDLLGSLGAEVVPT